MEKIELQNEKAALNLYFFKFYGKIYTLKMEVVMENNYINEQLLNQIAIWSNREQMVRHEKYKRGESFNIFKACGVDHYEVTHSSIIAEFLNPKGSHGQGTLFVEAFIEKLKLQDFDFSLNDIVVSTEYVIPNGRFDIIIYNGDKQAIIIENKIKVAEEEKIEIEAKDNESVEEMIRTFRISANVEFEEIPGLSDKVSNLLTSGANKKVADTYKAMGKEAGSAYVTAMETLYDGINWDSMTPDEQQAAMDKLANIDWSSYEAGD